MKFLRIYLGLPKNTYILFFVQLINRAGDFVIPFLSLFLVSKLGLGVGLSGVIVTCATLLQIPGSMAGGTIADYWSRKKTYLISQTASAVCILLCAFTQRETLLIALLLLSTLFSSAAKPLINTMIYDSLAPEKRRVGQSLSYLGVNLGVCVGPIVAGFLFNNYLKLFFIGDALTSFVAVLLVALRLRETGRAGTQPREELITTKQFFLRVLKQPRISVFFLIYMLYCFIYAQNSFSLPLALTDSFGTKGSAFYGYVISINALTVVSATALITFYTRKRSALFNVTMAGVFYGLGFGLITIATNFWVYILSTVLWTIGEILVSTNSEIYVVNQSDKNMRARCCASMLVVSSVGRALGVAAMGKYIDVFGMSTVWLFIMALAFGVSVFTGVFRAKLGDDETRTAVQSAEEI